MTNSRHKHKWRFVKNGYTGHPYAGNSTRHGIYKCKCGALKKGRPHNAWDDIEP